MTPPRYEHDCEGCIFLGRHAAADLYYCPHEPTVIARRSSEGGDYSSGLSFVGRHPALTEAYNRASARGLLSSEAIALATETF